MKPPCGVHRFTQLAKSYTLRHAAKEAAIPYNEWIWVSYQMRKCAGCSWAGNAGNVFPAPNSEKTLNSDPGMHHGTCVTHVPLCMSGSLTRGGGENSRYSLRMRNSQLCVSGKRPINEVPFLPHAPPDHKITASAWSVVWSSFRCW